MVRVIDLSIEFLETPQTETHLEDFKASNVKDANEGSSLPLGAVEGFVDARDQPLEHALVASLRDGLHSKLHLQNTRKMFKYRYIFWLPFCKTSD